MSNCGFFKWQSPKSGENVFPPRGHASSSAAFSLSWLFDGSGFCLLPPTSDFCCHAKFVCVGSVARPPRPTVRGRHFSSTRFAVLGTEESREKSGSSRTTGGPLEVIFPLLLSRAAHRCSLQLRYYFDPQIRAAISLHAGRSFVRWTVFVPS